MIPDKMFLGQPEHVLDLIRPIMELVYGDLGEGKVSVIEALGVLEAIKLTVERDAYKWLKENPEDN